MLKYALRENLLTPAPDKYMAQTADVRSYTLDEIISLMMEKGSSVTRADAAAVLQVYGEVCALVIANGSALNTPLFNTSMSISGVFDGANDAFDKKRHAVNLNLTAGTLLRDAVQEVKCEKTQIASTGGIVQITGSRLKFDAKDETQGIFFVPETGTAVRAAVIAENKPARLTALIPQTLDAGIRYIEIRTKMLDNNKSLKTMKVGRFAKPLTVTA